MNAAHDVLALGCQEQQPGLVFGEFFERHHVNGAKTLNPRTQFFNARLGCSQIKIFIYRLLTRQLLQRPIKLRGTVFTYEG